MVSLESEKGTRPREGSVKTLKIEFS